MIHLITITEMTVFIDSMVVFQGLLFCIRFKNYDEWKRVSSMPWSSMCTFFKVIYLSRTAQRWICPFPSIIRCFKVQQIFHDYCNVVRSFNKAQHAKYKRSLSPYLCSLTKRYFSTKFDNWSYVENVVFICTYDDRYVW